jgi:hypothetical protein
MIDEPAAATTESRCPTFYGEPLCFGAFPRCLSRPRHKDGLRLWEALLPER